jgi:hypothetical protein
MRDRASAIGTEGGSNKSGICQRWIAPRGRTYTEFNHADQGNLATIYMVWLPKREYLSNWV